MAEQPFRVRASTERIKTIAEALRQITTGIGADLAERHRAAYASSQHLRDESGSAFSAGTNALVDQQVLTRVEEERRQQIDRAEQEAIPFLLDLGVHIAFVREAAAGARPARDTSSSAAILLTKEKWDTVVAALNTGRSFAEIIRRADVDTLIAIESFAPDYVRLNGIRHFSAEEDDQAVETTLTRITEAVTTRLVEVADSDVAEILKLARHADGWHQVASTWIDLLRRKVAGDINADPLEYAIAESYILRNLGLAPTAAEIDAQRNAASSAAASAGFATLGGRL